VLRHAIEVDDVELPARLPLFFDKKILVFEVADVEPRGVESAKELCESPKKCTSMLPGPS
jgi:hypothetical protein